MSDMSPRPICIIGAGLGGLTLGQSLLKRGIPAVIYDRSSSKSRHSYGITLHKSTYQPLSNALGLDPAAFRKEIAVDAGCGGSGNIDPSCLAHPSGSITRDSFRANRQKLELLLRKDLDIRWEHQLDKVEYGHDEEVKLCMSGGQEVTTNHVIASDGPHSRARMSVLPDIQPTVLPIVAFNGKRRVERAVFNELYSPLFNSGNIIETRKNGAILNISISDVQNDLVSISWIYSRAAKPQNDPLHRPTRPNAGAEEIPEHFYDEISRLKDLDQPFADVFDEKKLRSERILSWLMRTVDTSLEDLQATARKGVSFIGDAVHAEPILGGEGANAAMADGMELAEYITAQGVDSVSEWYQTKYPKWRDSVEQSKRAIAEMHAVDKAAL